MMTETLVVVEPHEEEQAMAAAFVGDQPPRLVAGGEPAEPAERVVLSLRMTSPFGPAVLF